MAHVRDSRRPSRTRTEPAPLLLAAEPHAARPQAAAASRRDLRPATRPAGRRRTVVVRRAAAASVAVAALAGGSLVAGSSYADSPNLVLNPGFENGLTGWYAAAPYALDHVDDEHRGDHAVRLVNVADTARSGALNDLRNTVTTTEAGHTYRARAYVRSDVPGLRVAVRLMEYRGSVLRGEKATTIALPDDEWHRVTVRYTAVSDGATLDLNVLGRSLPAGGSVLVDDLKLVDEGTGTATPASVPSPVISPSSSPATTPSPAPEVSGTPTATSAPPQEEPTKEPTKEPEPTTTTTTKPAAPAERPGWTLKWADEFDGADVDESRWKVDHLSTYGDGNKELACLMNRSQNLFQSGGVLTIRARKESSPVACGSKDSRFPDGRTYTSAMMKTNASWTYGRFEMRAKLPTAVGESKGLWPAFWMRPAAGGTGELDILEVIGTGSNTAEARKVHQTLWYDYNGTHPKQTFTATTPFDPAAGFHTYAVEWEKGEIRWYVDGDLTYKRTTATTPWLDDAFSKPFIIRLNMAVGGNWPGSPEAGTAFPADYEVDYVRVYQRD